MISFRAILTFYSVLEGLCSVKSFPVILTFFCSLGGLCSVISFRVILFSLCVLRGQCSVIAFRVILIFSVPLESCIRIILTIFCAFGGLRSLISFVSF